MAIIYITVGCSGSGKSRLAANVFSDIKEINADNIRLSLCGDISDQSKNDEVFRIVDSMIHGCCVKDEDAIISNTNLNLDRTIALANEYPKDEFIMLLLRDSLNKELCWSRIQKDIEDKKVRSNVSYEILGMQCANFKKLVDRLEIEKLPDNLSFKWIDN